MSIVLVINSGSSSLKYQLIDMSDESTLASGLIERIGEEMGAVRHSNATQKVQYEAPTATHDDAFATMLKNFAEVGPDLKDAVPTAVGHRVVQGARQFFGPTLIDEKAELAIEELSPLAPLHNPANLAGIRAAKKVFADIPHVAVFDSAFHTTISDAASTYALNKEVAEKYLVRKYGAHGTSHKFVSAEAAAFLGKPVEELSTVVLHVGNGASACAVDGGKSVETSMGFTPLEGLVMGTRTGDIDPAVLLHLIRKGDFSCDDLDELLNRKSGLLGLTGTNDMRDVLSRAEAGDKDAELGLNVYIHRLRHYLGSYLFKVRGGDVIVFTGGVGENATEVRRRTLEGLEWFGIELDPERNALPNKGIREISTDASRVRVLVVPTNEELEIARQTITTVTA